MNIENVLSELWRLTPSSFAEKISAGKFVRYRHIEFVSQIIAREVYRGGARIIISMPPRHGKSFLISTYTPPWFLSHFPDRNVILCSYEADFAAHWGRQVRNLIKENSETIGVSLTEDSQAADRWHTTRGGGMITAGVGGPVTGRGGHLVIVDDPVKNSEQAYSEVYRKKTIEWFNSTLYTRLEPGASLVILMTRWHEDDLVGHLLRESSDPWLEIKIPAIAEEADPLGRIPGEALCAERFNEEKLHQIREAVGSLTWNALYQQRPSSIDGNIFKRSWIKYYDCAPENYDSILQSWDLTFKNSKTSDFVVGQVWQKTGGNLYLIDQVRARMNFPEVVSAIRAMTAKYPRCESILVEDKANGPAVISTLTNEIASIIPVEPDGSKESRAAAVSSFFEAGNVYVPDPKIHRWVNEYIDELCNFPNAKHDDQVDATSQALRRISDFGGVHMIMSVPINW